MGFSAAAPRVPEVGVPGPDAVEGEEGDEEQHLAEED